MSGAHDLYAAVVAAEEYFANLPADDDVAHPLYQQMNAAIARATQERAEAQPSDGAGVPVGEVERITRWASEAADRAEKHGNTEGVWLLANQWRTVADALTATPKAPLSTDAADLPILIERILELARRDIRREQTDFVGRMHQAMGGFEAVCDDHPDGDWPEDARDEAGDNLAALAGLAVAQLAMVSQPADPLAALASTTNAGEAA